MKGNKYFTAADVLADSKNRSTPWTQLILLRSLKVTPLLRCYTLFLIKAKLDECWLIDLCCLNVSHVTYSNKLN